jgi:hypothetical protein
MKAWVYLEAIVTAVVFLGALAFVLVGAWKFFETMKELL